MYDKVLPEYGWRSAATDTTPTQSFGPPIGGGSLFWSTKRVFDVVVAVLAIPIIIAIAAALLLLNPLWNPGPLLFRQQRMGLGGQPMIIWKFRSMRAVGAQVRGPADPVESDRITPLGNWLRRTRLDELPQIVNVLCGEMSLVGPRPDCLSHAEAYAATVPGYRARYSVRPGISGFAQVRLGYAEGFELTARKTRLDLVYIRKASWRLEAIILRRTFVVMSTGFGAR